MNNLPTEPRVRSYEYQSRCSLAPESREFRGGNVRMMAMAKQAAPMMMNDMMMDAAPMLGKAPKKPVEIRTKFPETWLFDNLEFDSG